MAGHIEDRWYRDKIGPDGKLVLNARGKSVQERTELYGKGLRYRVRYYNDEGRERSKSFPDKKLGKAEDFLVSVQHDVLSGVFVDQKAGQETFRTYAMKWLKGQSQDAATVQTVSSRLRAQIYPFLGDKPLNVVEKPDTVRDWMDWMRSEGPEHKKIGASYQAGLFDLVSAILEAAKEERKIRKNPCKAKSIKKPKREQRKLIPWPESTVHALQSELPDRYDIIVPLGAGQALRQMEIMAISPSDINHEDMELNVVRQIRWIGSQPVFAPPKGGKTRVVPLAQGVAESIEEHQQQHSPVDLTLPWLEPNGEPVTVSLMINYCDTVHWRGSEHTRSQPWRAGNFDATIWQPAFQRAGLVYTPRRDGMHAMRHFCASNWLAQGVSIKEVAEYLGHHDPGYTLRIYTHLVPSSHKRARIAVDRVFKPRRKTRST